MKMGLDVSRIFALAEGSFHIKNMKKATLGTNSSRSQNLTLRQKSQRWDKRRSTFIENRGFICSYKHTSTAIHFADKTIAWKQANRLNILLESLKINNHANVQPLKKK